MSTLHAHKDLAYSLSFMGLLFNLRLSPKAAVPNLQGFIYIYIYTYRPILGDKSVYPKGGRESNLPHF